MSSDEEDYESDIEYYNDEDSGGEEEGDLGKIQFDVTADQEEQYEDKPEEINDDVGGRKSSKSRMGQEISKGRTEVSIDDYSISDVIYRGIFPPPLQINQEVVTDIHDVDVPGEIKISPSGKLLRKYLTYNNFFADIITGYNSAITKGIPENIHGRTINLPNGHIIRFLKVYYVKPTTDVMTPLKAREIDSSYEAEVWVDVAEFDAEGEIVIVNDVQKISKVKLGSIPIMIGSVLDITQGKSEIEKEQMGECSKDPQGYFIINGNEYIVLLRDQLRLDRIMISSSAKNGLRCNMTCRTKIGTVIVKLLTNDKNPIKGGEPGEDDPPENASADAPAAPKGRPKEGNIKGAIMISLQFIGQNTINLFIIYYLLGYTNTADIMSMILMHTQKKNVNKVRAILAITLYDFVGLSKGNMPNIGEGAVHVIAGKVNPPEIKNARDDYHKYREKYRKEILKYLFPQIPENDVENKLHLLSIMTSRYAETIAGLRKPDSKDNWGNKRIMSAGFRFTQLIGQCIRKVITSINKKNEKETTGNINTLRGGREKNFFEEAVKRLNLTNIHEDFRSSFTTKKWGCRGSDKRDENTTEPLARLSILDAYSHATQIKTKTDTKTKNTRVREVEPSQLGYIDPIYSPEGGNCGIVKAKALTCWISADRGSSSVMPHLFGSKEYIHSTPIQGSNVCIMDGRLMGWCNGPVLRDFLISKRRNLEIPMDVAIVLDLDGILWIDTRDQRPTRPLLIVNQDTGNLVIDEKDLWGNDFQDLVAGGAVEYIDAWEQEFAYLAEHINDIAYRQDEILRLAEEIRDLRSQIVSITGKTEEIKIGEQNFEDIKFGFTTKSNIEKKNNYEERRLRMELEFNESNLEMIRNSPSDEDIIQAEVGNIEHEIELLKSDQIDTYKQLVILKSEIDDLPEDSYEREIRYEEFQQINEQYHQITDQYNILFEKNQDPNRDNKIIQEYNTKKYLNELEIEGQLKTLKDKLSRVGSSRYDSRDDSRGGSSRESNVIDESEENTLEQLQDQLKGAVRAFNRYYKKGPYVNYTHCELDPNAIMGVAASIIPLPDHNQAPRNTYQCNMGRQSLGIYNSAHQYRFDTTAKLLAYPSRPTFETQMYDILGLNNLPAGNMVIIAIAPFFGYNQEDSLIFKKGAIDRGLFNTIVYHSVTVLYNKNEGQVNGKRASEQLGLIEKGIRRTKNDQIYHAIDDYGIAKIGSLINTGDCLVSKTLSIGNEKIDNSIYATADQVGRVERIVFSKGVIKIKLSQHRKPEIGDKFASRHAQKSTIGRIVNDEDMPFTSDGVSPDLIMNPHGIPSRMTIGMLIEILTSKSGALTGERINATAFNDFDVDEFRRSLTSFGYSQSGKETLYDGSTGKKMKAQIFIGPCYYQALKHNVKDKIQSRSIGSIDAITRGPLGGRTRNGGQRAGEMEKDSFVSHGAGALLNERLCLSSDAYKAVYCKSCGTISTSNYLGNYTCSSCDSGTFGTCTVPYPMRALSHLMGGANLRIKYRFEE